VVEDRLCPACAAYLCRGDDAWCGYCGEPCAQLVLELKPEVLHVGEKPSRVSVKAINTSCATIRVSYIDLPEWLHATLSKNTSIAPGALHEFKVDVVERLHQTTIGKIELVTTVGTVGANLMVIDLNPKLVCEPSRVAGWFAGNGRHSRSRVKIRPGAGLLRVFDVQLRGARISVPPDLEGDGRLVGEGDELEVEISPVANVHGAASVRATLDLDYKSPHGIATTSAELELDLHEPPQLRWTGQFSAPEVRRQTSGQRLRFEFRNQSPEGNDGGLQNGTLVIESAELSAISLPGVIIKRLTHLPIEVEGGAGEVVEFELDLSALQGRPAELATLRLKTKTNHPTLEWEVPLKIEPMQVFGGVVAIDFGSSNSCCAVWQQGEEPALLPLDEHNAMVSPTVVRYLTLQTTPPGIETGERVKRLAAEHAEVAASTADRLKQRLGDVEQQISLRPEVEARWVERKASEAAFDYLYCVRRMAESARGAVFHSFILTHPARCSLRQYARLRQALVQAFGSAGNQIRFLQEPIAALIDYLVEKAQTDSRRDYPDYTVASFDLGGGTTDIALVNVQYDSTQAGRLHIRPRILYCRGERFGGEDLTDFLINELAMRCQHYFYIKGGTAGPTLIGEGQMGAAELDIRRNRAKFRRVAEQFKASLSIEAATAQNRVPEHIDLRVLDEGKTRTEQVPFKIVSSGLEGWDNLEKKFLEHTRTEIAQRADLLRKAVEATRQQLDVIHLSGKTTYLAVASEAVGSSLPGVSIKLAPQPKECVVKGACLSRSLRRGNLVIELNVDDQRMTSTVGGFSLDKPYFEPILRVDEVIPPEGLVGKLPLAWDGSESIVLWEDMDGTERRVLESEASRDLQRLGTWEPTAQRRVENGQWWTVRVRLQDFRLAVEAISPGGDSVAFRPLHGNGE
jgi:molecular chaperone DnaK (HSP70)